MSDFKQHERLTKTQINELELLSYPGEITVVNNEELLKKAISVLEKEKILGFDTETKPAYQKGESYLPSLLQLAGENHVYLFQIGQMGLSESLVEVLENKTIVKTGVSLKYDVKELRKLRDFQSGGFVELETLAEKAGVLNLGLRGLTAAVLGFRISKNAQQSNWAKKELTYKQIRYAATDAWVGRELYLKLSY